LDSIRRVGKSDCSQQIALAYYKHFAEQNHSKTDTINYSTLLGDDVHLSAKLEIFFAKRRQGMNITMRLKERGLCHACVTY